MFRKKIWNVLAVVGVSMFLVVSLYTSPVYVYSDLTEETLQQGKTKQIIDPKYDMQENLNLKPNEKQKSKSKPQLKRILN